MSDILTLLLYVQPGASRTEVCGEHDGRIKIRLKAPPVDGKANQALCVFLAEAFGVKKSQVVLKSGETSRLKMIEIVMASQMPEWYQNSSIRSLK